MNNENNESIIANFFIHPKKRERFLELCKGRSRNNKRFRKYGVVFSNFDYWLNPNCKITQIPSFHQHNEILLELARLGVNGPGYVMSQDKNLDARTIPIAEVFSYLEKNKVYGTLISFINSGIAYYEQCELANLSKFIRAVGN